MSDLTRLARLLARLTGPPTDRLSSDPRVVLLCDDCHQHLPRARFAAHTIMGRVCPGGVGDV